MSRSEDRALVSGLLALLLVLWGGFLVHTSPRFPGSLAGGVVGIGAATAMWVPTFFYALAKRSAALKARLPPRVPMRQVLTWHVRFGIIGALLAIVHSAHRFESPVAIVLTGLLLVSVTTGYVGRFFLGLVASGLRQQTADLARAKAAFDVQAVEAAPESAGGAGLSALAEAVVDLEYAVALHDRLAGRAGLWLRLHRIASYAFLAVLVLHVAAALYLGLRWW